MIGTREERFWAKILREDKISSPHVTTPCWRWTGKKDEDGYGKLKTTTAGKLKLESAHRISWEIHFGKPPADKFVCHKCDQADCCNPEHLFVGTAVDNNRDMAQKGRAHSTNVWARKLTDIQVLEIRATPRFCGMEKAFMKRFGVSSSVISEIVHGLTYQHLQPTEDQRKTLPTLTDPRLERRQQSSVRTALILTDRKMLGVNQAKLADALGIARSYLCQLEGNTVFWTDELFEKAKTHLDKIACEKESQNPERSTP